MIFVIVLLVTSIFITKHSIVNAQASSHGIKLTWTQSTGTGLVSNTVYRSNVSGGPYTQIFTGAPTTTYDDPWTSSNQGTKACYVVTATGSASFESGFSNEACATFLTQTPSVTGNTATSH